ncbi:MULTISPECIES: hypothetical protein [unclassified Acidovorax]|uniref:hypothetical protein n=1 Tax=unclassified Acidovorax TaxID=2684926 RepID=UPI0028831DF5|nr:MULTISPECIES: hypothetical protein [unclassified Acidovorax]
MSHPNHLLPSERAAHVLSVTAQAWDVSAPAAKAVARRSIVAAARAVVCRDRRSASPSRLRLSAHGFDISY